MVEHTVINIVGPTIAEYIAADNDDRADNNVSRNKFKMASIDLEYMCNNPHISLSTYS